MLPPDLACCSLVLFLFFCPFFFLVGRSFHYESVVEGCDSALSSIDIFCFRFVCFVFQFLPRSAKTPTNAATSARNETKEIRDETRKSKKAKKKKKKKKKQKIERTETFHEVRSVTKKLGLITSDSLLIDGRNRRKYDDVHYPRKYRPFRPVFLLFLFVFLGFLVFGFDVSRTQHSRKARASAGDVKLRPHVSLVAGSFQQTKHSEAWPIRVPEAAPPPKKKGQKISKMRSKRNKTPHSTRNCSIIFLLIS